ncbi:MAG: hypothetical protein Fur002_11660 [Anaerolineales bacterium]
MNRVLRIAFFVLFLAACAAPAVSTPAPRAQPFSYAPLSKPSAVFSATEEKPAAPTLTPSPEPSLTPSASPSATLPPPPSPTVETLPPTQTEPAPLSPFRANYVIYALMDFPARTLSVSETIRYYNNSGATLSEIVLAVEPNLWANVFSLEAATQNNAAIENFSLDGQRLTLPLAQNLPAGAAADFKLDFTLALPQKGSGLFGYDYNQINLVDWYPFIVPYQNGWLLHEPAGFGEHLVYDAADIEVNLQTDSNVTIAAPAPAEPNGEWTRYRLSGARTFSLSASDEFLTEESAVGNTVIRSYYFSGYQAAAKSILYSATQAVSLYAAKFAPYPYETLAIVQADIHDGQEEDGLVFLSSKFYGQYGGGAKNNLTTIGVHEIAHQWWFGLVGNDQAQEPWLDEAMSAYSEKIFYEYNYPNYGSWWWDFRVDYFSPSGYVDSSIYDQATFRAYTNAVYLHGAHFIDDLRIRMGDDDFFRFIKDYAARYARGRAASADFFAVAREHTSADLTHLIANYFAGSY